MASAARTIAFLRAVACVVFLVLGLSPLAAQDSVAAPEAALALPPAPRGYDEMRTSGARWTFPEGGRREVDALEAHRRDASRTLADELGLANVDPVVLRLARNPNEMNALAPRGLPPPSYADGVAYPSLGVILLTRTGHQPANPPNLEQTLVHELAHVLLDRAVHGHEVPRWFTEGFAIHSARERSLERTKLLWEATAQRRLVPFTKLPEAFADGSHEVDIAYAQAADVVAYLFRVDDGAYKMRRLIAELGEGATFEHALETAYFVDLRTLEREWRADLWNRHSAYPLIAGGTGLWAIATVFLVLAYVKRRRIAKRKLAVWAHEEAELSRIEAEARAEAAARLVALSTAESLGDDESAAREGSAGTGATSADTASSLLEAPAGKPLMIRDERVPTVEHEGRTYTLH